MYGGIGELGRFQSQECERRSQSKARRGCVVLESEYRNETANTYRMKDMNMVINCFVIVWDRTVTIASVKLVARRRCFRAQLRGDILPGCEGRGGLGLTQRKDEQMCIEAHPVHTNYRVGSISRRFVKRVDKKTRARSCHPPRFRVVLLLILYRTSKHTDGPLNISHVDHSMPTPINPRSASYREYKVNSK